MIYHHIPTPQNVKNTPKMSSFIVPRIALKKYKIQHENVFDFNCIT